MSRDWLRPGVSCWWVSDRDGMGRATHLTLVTIRDRWRDSWHVRSARSERSYTADESDLLPLGAFLDPSDRCQRCGVERGAHKARHNFVWPV